MVHLLCDLFDPVVVLGFYDCLSELGFGYLGAQHDEVEHDQEFEERALGDVEMREGFEGEVTFFSFYWFVRCFFY